MWLGMTTMACWAYLWELNVDAEQLNGYELLDNVIRPKGGDRKAEMNMSRLILQGGQDAP